jgi:hypothetical protein
MAVSNTAYDELEEEATRNFNESFQDAVVKYLFSKF